MLDRNSQRG